MRDQVNRCSHRQRVGEIQSVLQRAYGESSVLETKDAITVAALQQRELTRALRRPQFAKASPGAGKRTVQENEVRPVVGCLVGKRAGREPESTRFGCATVESESWPAQALSRFHARRQRKCRARVHVDA